MLCEGTFYSFPFSRLFQNREVFLPKPAFFLTLLFHSFFPTLFCCVSLFFHRTKFLHSLWPISGVPELSTFTL